MSISQVLPHLKERQSIVDHFVGAGRNATSELTGELQSTEPIRVDCPSIFRQQTGTIFIPQLNRTAIFRLISTSARPIDFGEELPPLEQAIFSKDLHSFTYHERVELDHLLTGIFEVVA